MKKKRKTITVKFQPNERGDDNKAFDEAMKKNPPKMKMQIMTAKGIFNLPKI